MIVTLLPTGGLSTRDAETIKIRFSESKARPSARVPHLLYLQALTLSWPVVEPLRAAPVTVIVSVKFPVGADEDAFTVKVEEPELTIDAGLKLAVAPVGSPLKLRA